MDANQTKRKGITLDYRLVIVALLIIIVTMMVIWKPWEPQIDAKSRTITVVGKAKVTATPDEYIFTPSYQFTNSDRQAALDAVTKKSDEIVGKLKSLGVADNKIKTNAGGYSYPIYKDGSNSNPTYTLQLTVTVDDKTLAQKVQDYLVTTAPTGEVSPQVTFSDAKQNQLESQARDQATKDARSKADQSAKNLGFNLGEVKSVTDGTLFGGVYPVANDLAAGAGQSSSPSKLTIQPGENDLTYQVSVVYFLK